MCMLSTAEVSVVTLCLAQCNNRGNSIVHKNAIHMWLLWLFAIFYGAMCLTMARLLQQLASPMVHKGLEIPVLSCSTA